VQSWERATIRNSKESATSIEEGMNSTRKESRVTSVSCRSLLITTFRENPTLKVILVRIPLLLWLHFVSRLVSAVTSVCFDLLTFVIEKHIVDTLFSRQPGFLVESVF
jgi:hypothetical protein